MEIIELIKNISFTSLFIACSLLIPLLFAEDSNITSVFKKICVSSFIVFLITLFILKFDMIVNILLSYIIVTILSIIIIYYIVSKITVAITKNEEEK